MKERKTRHTHHQHDKKKQQKTNRQTNKQTNKQTRWKNLILLGFSFFKVPVNNDVKKINKII